MEEQISNGRFQSNTEVISEKSTYFFEREWGTSILRVNLEINHINKLYFITPGYSKENGFKFYGVNHVEQTEAICKLITQAAKFANDILNKEETIEEVEIENLYPPIDTLEGFSNRLITKIKRGLKIDTLGFPYITIDRLFDIDINTILLEWKLTKKEYVLVKKTITKYKNENSNN